MVEILIQLYCLTDYTYIQELPDNLLPARPVTPSWNSRPC